MAARRGRAAERPARPDISADGTMGAQKRGCDLSSPGARVDWADDCPRGQGQRNCGQVHSADDRLTTPCLEVQASRVQKQRREGARASAGLCAADQREPEAERTVVSERASLSTGRLGTVVVERRREERNRCGKEKKAERRVARRCLSRPRSELRLTGSNCCA